MRSLYNLSIRAKILLITFPLLAGVLYLILIRTLDSLSLSQSMDKLEKGVTLSTRVSYLVHEIQKERGNSSGFLANQDQSFRNQLNDQRILTDEQYDNYKSALADPDLAQIIAENQQTINELNRLLREIEQIRTEVDQIRLTSNQAIDRYTEINTFALNALDQVIPTSENSDVTREVQAYINFLKSKERAGIERAVGSQAFSLGTLNAELYRRFSTLVAAQNSYIDAFLVTVNADGKSHYENTVKGSAVDEVERMRDLMYQNADMDEDPIYWFATITKKIELLKNVEDFLTDQVVVVNDHIQAGTFRRERGVICSETKLKEMIKPISV
ncbi:MAG: nitrate- and nitrite sensing domain-containing protein [Cytophagales bacterium]|nr:nitrate- and nitrite sensing domain-containing protein [Cytophagales bacterium]